MRIKMESGLRIEDRGRFGLRTVVIAVVEVFL